MNQAKPEQKVRLKPEQWELIEKQKDKEKRSKAQMISLLIERGLSHPDSLYFNPVHVVGVIDSSKLIQEQTKTKEAKATFGGISYDPNKLKL